MNRTFTDNILTTITKKCSPAVSTYNIAIVASSLTYIIGLLVCRLRLDVNNTSLEQFPQCFDLTTKSSNSISQAHFPTGYQSLYLSGGELQQNHEPDLPVSPSHPLALLSLCSIILRGYHIQGHFWDK